jgi:hypothetical protein
MLTAQLLNRSGKVENNIWICIVQTFVLFNANVCVDRKVICPALL